ncbi:hypothetical protein Y032_0703g1674 [Ancylostoma ceylanicum]|uniref:Uncharacterized protein n=1 Tax=Ancylostoma ceylanicum TaxID=53326 RepID=A0A016WFS5_9BILA|nr:hypothetical protein Y032_0703g1674 [Ancylostoma ceylanicum]
MWRSLLAAVLMFSAVLPIAYAYSRFGQQASHEIGVSSNGPSRINDKILSGSNIHYYGRFRNGQDDVLSRYFQRLA